MELIPLGMPQWRFPEGGFAVSDQPMDAIETQSTPFLRLKRDLLSWLQALVFALVFLICCFTFLGRIISVDGESMLPTLHDKDLLLLQSIGYTPRQGDIVVVNKPFRSVNEPIIKRVIATEGQTVKINYEEGLVYVDGVPLEEPYINGPMQLPSSPTLTIQDITVPDNQIFVMGDNRNHSSDSRDESLGTVDERYVLGQAFVVLLPFPHFGTVSS